MHALLLSIMQPLHAHVRTLSPQLATRPLAAGKGAPASASRSFLTPPFTTPAVNTPSPVGRALQVVAQASPTVDGASPDLEKGAAALDAAGETEGLPPPYRTWREALEAWTDWRGESEGDGSGGSDSGGGANAGSEEKKSVGRSGISPVPAASARAALALGKYRVNWNFDDWRGYAKERRRLYESVLPNARRAMVLGGDSHDAWAGTVSADARDWNPARGYLYDSSGRPRTPTGDESVDRRSGADDRWAAVEFDVPGVTPPGAHERAFPWLPFELSDAGHLAANAPTMRFAKSGRRGFALVTFETGASKRATATFVATPEVREDATADELPPLPPQVMTDPSSFSAANALSLENIWLTPRLHHPVIVTTTSWCRRFFLRKCATGRKKRLSLRSIV